MKADFENTVIIHLLCIVGLLGLIAHMLNKIT